MLRGRDESPYLKMIAFVQGILDKKTLFLEVKLFASLSFALAAADDLNPT